MHSSTLLLVAIASLMVSFTSAKGTSRGNDVHVNGIPQGSGAVYVSKRKLNKRKTTSSNDYYAEPAGSQGSPVGLDTVTGLLGGVSGGGAGGLAGGLI
ncbi:uncharacterized protein EV154DRAFT_522169 [Mucor mucedo]|uniref:uncharacterized protein n=1 Tax=Mucor mucedo TaxID=29922 RepID=UPI00221ED310|nr:uncharacterized protein EV154DRAFT_522169 [Mucor mucedo]KAI7884451.1 hypothetical protein EV154DRAFT_522169 [Mucor mucedo]